MEPDTTPAMLALRTPLRLTTVLVGLLVFSGSAAAQLPALPSTDDLPIDTDLDVGADTPVGSIDASSHDGAAQACTDLHASADSVTGQVPAVPVAAPIPVPVAVPQAPTQGLPAADLSGCTEIDAAQATDDAMEQADGAKGQAGSALNQVKSFFDDIWGGLSGLF